MPYRPGPSKSWLKIKNPAHPAMMRIQEAFDAANILRQNLDEEKAADKKLTALAEKKINLRAAS